MKKVNKILNKMSGGWLFKAAESNSDTFTGAALDDALFVHKGSSNRFIFGASNEIIPFLVVSGTGVQTPSIACGSNVLTTASGMIDARMIEGQLLSHAIADSNVLENHIADSAVTSMKLAGSNVLENHIADSNVLERHLVNSAVTSMKLADSNVLERHLLNSAVTSMKIAGSNVLANHIADSNVLERHLLNSAVTSTKLANSNVLERHLVNSAVTSLKIADSNVLERHIANSAVTLDKIADGAVAPRKLQGLVPVSSGGTGLGGAPAGSLLFTSTGSEALSFSSALKFDPSQSNFAAGNAFFDGRAHAGNEMIIGRPGSRRFRLAIGGASNQDLVVSSIAPDGTEAPYLNLGDLVALLDNVNVYQP